MLNWRYIKIQSVPRSKHSVSVIQTSQLMLYREIIAVCSQIHTKHINTLCGQNVELLNVKLGSPYSTMLDRTIQLPNITARSAAHCYAHISPSESAGWPELTFSQWMSLSPNICNMAHWLSVLWHTCQVQLCTSQIQMRAVAVTKQCSVISQSCHAVWNSHWTKTNHPASQDKLNYWRRS